ncbi:MAG: DNA-binding protein [Candidatus Aenigmatarchaeota archaeon]|nr:MAG: DNA-binding protein [Candidatus Aenigmarchaeota archaeon]
MTNGMDGVDMNQLAQMKQLEEMKRTVLSRILTKEAFERLSRIRSVNPALANQVDIYLLQIYQTGKVTDPITDEKLKDILKLLSEKKDFKIKRK